MGEHGLVQTFWRFEVLLRREVLLGKDGFPPFTRLKFATETVSVVTSLAHFFFIPHWEQILPPRT